MIKRLGALLLLPAMMFMSCAQEVPPEDVFDNPLDEDEVTYETPALTFYPLDITIALGASQTVDVFVLGVENLAGSSVTLSYDQNKLSVLSMSVGEFFTDAVQAPVFFAENDAATGTIEINTSFLGSDSVSVSGTGSLASIVFTSTTDGQSSLVFDTSCEFVDPSDNPILIKGFGKELSMLSRILFGLCFISVVLGQPTFSSHTIDGGYGAHMDAYPIDLDLDGDMINAERGMNQGSGMKIMDLRVTQYVISNEADGVYSVFAIDLDRDGDIDVLSASTSASKISWYENNGSQSFTEHTIITDYYNASCVYAIDMDLDGDIDVVSTAFGDGKVSWHQNDGSQNFTTITIDDDMAYAFDVLAKDMDNDGDIDVLATGPSDSVSLGTIIMAAKALQRVT